MSNDRKVIDLIGTPLEMLIVKHRASDKSKRIERIVSACRYASEEDIKLIERILRLNANL